MTKTILKLDEVRPYVRAAHAVKVDNTVYVSGNGAIDSQGNLVGKGDIEAQTICIFENIKKVLQAADASLSDVVYTVAYLKNIDDREKFLAVRSRYLRDHHYASVAIYDVTLGMSDALAEVTVIAVIE